MAAVIRPRAAIFDIGATLVTGPPVAPNKVIAELLNGVSHSDVASVIMTTDLTCADGVCAALETRFGMIGDKARAGISELWGSQATAAQALDGAEDVVRDLKRRGLKIGLLSDIWNPYYDSVERALPDVIKLADAIVLSCRTGARKPGKENFVKCLNELEARPGEAVMIGDTYTHDIRPALELGMRAVWVLARPDRECGQVIGVLNGELPAPTVTVSSIGEVAGLAIWQ